METGLKNKVAIVTGAGQGIGRGIALALAAEGCRVVVSDLNPDTAATVVGEIEAAGGTAHACTCDVSLASQVAALFSECLATYGELDIMVNNAGIYPFKSFAEMTEADWDKVLDVNLKSIFLTSKEAVKTMGEGGRIISISSIASLVGFEGLVHYATTKGGINAFTRTLALELAKRKITVNAIAPGAIDTPGASGSSDEELAQTLALIPLAREGVPADIASAVVFLASDQASYITGQVLVVDGGWTLR